jgi:hypothetical protein
MRKVLIPFGTILLLSFHDALAQPTTVSDTLVVTTACVVFYQCTKAEYDSLFEQMPFGLDSMVSKFTSMQERIILFMKNFGIAHVSTGASSMFFHGNELSR